MFQYTVRITNQGTETVQLLTRHWIITDGVGHVEEVRGPGVVGEQPVLAEGESFKYSSWCRLKTPTGVMHGTYQMVRPDGTQFDIEIAPFGLRARYTVNSCRTPLTNPPSHFPSSNASTSSASSAASEPSPW